MAHFVIGGRALEMPAHAVAKAASAFPDAWPMASWISVETDGIFWAFRLSTELSLRAASAIAGGGRGGGWILLGHSHANARSWLEGARTGKGKPIPLQRVVVQVGTKLNVGLPSSMFPQAQGGFQAEFVSGPGFVHEAH